MTQIKLIVTIFGDSLNPKLFSDIAKLQPTAFWFKDDIVPNRKNNLLRKETAWEYSQGFIETLFLEDLSKLFIQGFKNNIDSIAKYINEHNLETRINIVVNMINDEKPSLSFDKEFMNLIVKMNGEVDIDIYSFDK